MVNVHIVSTNIQRVGWKNRTLYIQFNSGKSYAYENVDFKVYTGLATAESAGRFFHLNVKSKYKYTELACNPFETESAAVVAVKKAVFREVLAA